MYQTLVDPPSITSFSTSPSVVLDKKRRVSPSSFLQPHAHLDLCGARLASNTHTSTPLLLRTTEDSETNRDHTNEKHTRYPQPQEQHKLPNTCTVAYPPFPHYVRLGSQPPPTPYTRIMKNHSSWLRCCSCGWCIFRMMMMMMMMIHTVTATTLTTTPTRTTTFVRGQPHQQQQRHQDEQAQDGRLVVVTSAQVARAVQWTAHLNQQLESSCQVVIPETKQQQEQWLIPPQRRRLLHVPRGGHGVALQEPREQQESLFCATPFRVVEDGGTAVRYGPPLPQFVETVLYCLWHDHQANQPQHPRVDDRDAWQSHVLTSALVYLDRATCVLTPRSHPNTRSVPYCTPRTVHRLLLAALVVAHEEVLQQPQYSGGIIQSPPNAHHQQQDRLWQRLEQTLLHNHYTLDDESAATLQDSHPLVPALVHELRRALGDFGTLVTPMQRRDWTRRCAAGIPVPSLEE